MLAYRLERTPEEERAAAVASFRAVAAQARLVAIRCARAILALERTRAHYHEGAASIPEFAERHGMSSFEARTLYWLGRALRCDPTIEAEVASGAIPVASAAVLAEVDAEPSLARSGDDWRGWARSMTTRQLRRRFFQKRDEAHQHADVMPLTAFVSQGTRDDLDRARELVSRKAHMPLTIGHTIGIVTSDWLEDHDPLRKEPGTRRVPHTSERPHDRYVPAEVDRHVRARTGDRCIVPLCDSSIWVHRSHRIPHVLGGTREADALDLLCDFHHFLYEQGFIRITGSPDAPTITTKDGRLLSEREPMIFPFPSEARGPSDCASSDFATREVIAAAAAAANTDIDPPSSPPPDGSSGPDPG